ncbi:MAG: LysR family transcriptional regulator, partial [Janthinobacterium sp.]
MDSESLRIFCSVASELSVTQAAARLARAPSSVTTRIQQLEADIGAALFVRTNKRMALTAAGERFLEYAQRLLALAEAPQADAADALACAVCNAHSSRLMTVLDLPHGAVRSGKAAGRTR